LGHISIAVLDVATFYCAVRISNTTGRTQIPAMERADANDVVHVLEPCYEVIARHGVAPATVAAKVMECDQASIRAS